jgi:predicted GIY-YIG superfamily endonuclease
MRRKLTPADFDFSLVARDYFFQQSNAPTYVYILALQNDSFYVGISFNAKARIANHIRGRGAKRAQRYGVQSVITSWKCAGRLEAAMWEAYFGVALSRKKPSDVSLEELRALYREALPRVKAELAAENWRNFTDMLTLSSRVISQGPKARVAAQRASRD